MKNSIAALLALSGLQATAEAGGFFHKHGGTYAPVASYSTGTSYGQTSAPTASPSAPIHPYSYYAALPNRARDYVAYGSDDFPFYGVPYGRPYDPWTWPYMSGSYGRGLARYYDPPVK